MRSPNETCSSWDLATSQMDNKDRQTVNCQLHNNYNNNNNINIIMNMMKRRS